MVRSASNIAVIRFIALPPTARSVLQDNVADHVGFVPSQSGPFGILPPVDSGRCKRSYQKGHKKSD
jgi:hypothetical protein